MNELDQIRTFLAIYETGSFTKAANRLAITKSVASRRLTALEADLETRLLTRNTRGVTPTTAGTSFYEDALRIIDELEDIKNQTRNERHGMAGNIRLAAPRSFGRSSIHQILLQIMAENPRITLETHFSDRHIDLVGEGYDLGLRIGKLKDSSLIARKLASIRLVIVASPQYLSQKGSPQTPNDLKNHNCIIYTNKVDAHIWHLGKDSDPHLIRVNGSLKTNSGDMQVDACLAGQGLIYIPYFYVHDYIQSGQLVTLLDDYILEPLGLYAIYPQSRHVNGRIKTLINLLADHFADPALTSII